MQSPQIIGADQHDRDLGGNPRGLPIFDTPQQMAGGIAVEAEVDGIAVAVEALPARYEFEPWLLLVDFPILGDGIPQEDQRRLFLPQFDQLFLVPFLPPRDVPRQRLGRHRRVGAGGESGEQRQGEGRTAGNRKHGRPFGGGEANLASLESQRETRYAHREDRRFALRRRLVGVPA